MNANRTFVMFCSVNMDILKCQYTEGSNIDVYTCYCFYSEGLFGWIFVLGTFLVGFYLM